MLRTTLARYVGLTGLTFALVACGGEDSPPQDGDNLVDNPQDGGFAGEPNNPDNPPPEDPQNPGPAGPGIPDTFQLPFVYTGYDGTNTYQARFVFGSALQNAPDLGIDVTAAQVTVENPALADLERVDMGPLGPTHFVIYTVTARAAGSTRINVTYQGQTASSDLTVYSYTPADVQLGAERYNNPVNPDPATRIACSTCHFAVEQGGIQHSPDYTAFWSEEQALEVVSQGQTTIIFLDGEQVSYDPEPNGLPHIWNLTPEEEKGIMAYMRSLPLIDFGP